MRGQESGSEHEREATDGSAAPATPPPSFGQLPPRTDPQPYGEAGVPFGGAASPFAPLPADPSPVEDGSPFAASGDSPAFTAPPPDDSPYGTAFTLHSEDDSPYGTASPDAPVFTPSPEDGAGSLLPAPLPEPQLALDSASGDVPSSDSTPSEAPRPPIPVYPGPPPNLPAPEPAILDDLPALPAFPGAQPWEAPSGEAAPYDWFADPAVPQEAATTELATTELLAGELTVNDPGTQEPASDPGWPHGPADATQQTGWPMPQDDAGDPGTGWPQPSNGLSAAWSQPADSGTTNSGWPQPADPGATSSSWQPPTPESTESTGSAWPAETSGQDAASPWPAEGASQEATQWPAEPVVPGAPPWQPPPAFTAAAAGMPVWPTPASQAAAMPPWPAATGELYPEDPAPDLASTNQASTSEPGADELTAALPLPDVLDQPTAFDTPPDRPSDPHAEVEHHNAFDATPAFPDQRGAFETPHDQHEPRDDEEHGAQPYDPNLTIAVTRAAEPGDVPVWPPLPAEPSPISEEGEHTVEVPRDALPASAGKLPELPFSPEIWRQQAAEQPPSMDLPTPPHGTPAGAGLFQPGQFVPPAPPPAAAPKAKSRKALLATLGVLLLAGVATGGFFAYRSMNAAQPADAESRPSASQPPPQPTITATEEPDAAGTSVLNSEETDPKALALAEAFPKKKIKVGGAVYTRVKADLAEGCDKAAAGPFADALREQKCSRVLRATYVDSKKRYAITTGIAVLPTKDAAMQADQAKNLGRNLWFRALPGAAGSGGERVHIAGGYAAGLIWGRYIVFSYATYADGHTPTAKEKGLGKVSGAFRDTTSAVLERRIAES